jgi:hypothetical protein
MDLRELLGFGFAIAALTMLAIGIWAASHYSSSKTYERELRIERRKRRERRTLEEPESSRT